MLHNMRIVWLRAMARQLMARLAYGPAQIGPYNGKAARNSGPEPYKEMPNVMQHVCFQQLLSSVHDQR